MSNKEPKEFCTFCGKEKVLVPNGYFSKTTGKPTYSFRCHTYGCKNNDICYNILCNSHRGFFKNTACTRCGKFPSESARDF